MIVAGKATSPKGARKLHERKRRMKDARINDGFIAVAYRGEKDRRPPAVECLDDGGNQSLEDYGFRDPVRGKK